MFEIFWPMMNVMLKYCLPALTGFCNQLSMLLVCNSETKMTY